MDRIFISELRIKNVRHLKNIRIPLSSDKAKHLILTGKNGSGKTSVLEDLSNYFMTMAESIGRDRDGKTAFLVQELIELEKRGKISLEIIENRLGRQREPFFVRKTGINLTFNQPWGVIKYSLYKGEFILAYYKAERIFQADVSNHIEKVELKDNYSITETPRLLFVKYLADLKVTEALARSNGKNEKADAISQWFDKFTSLLRKIFGDDSLELIFEEEKFSFQIREKGREPFDFNTLSSGFAAVLDIVLDIIIRMEKKTNRSFDFNIPGIVLVDEIETHLHIELQKSVLDLLTTIFPNIQFIVSTHSPFILNSIPDAVIYDLENHTLVENGLADIPYGGIVEGYFQSSEMSKTLEEKFTRYKELVGRQNLTDDDFEEIGGLEMFLNEIPDYLALNITTEYQRLKLEFESREDI
ncbi:MAG: ATP-binding protein [Lachnospiraceae bacterium]|nr:ATP-binding protein [Lachnospiraceae bacterium]